MLKNHFDFLENLPFTIFYFFLKSSWLCLCMRICQNEVGSSQSPVLLQTYSNCCRSAFLLVVFCGIVHENFNIFGNRRSLMVSYVLVILGFNTKPINFISHRYHFVALSAFCLPFNFGCAILLLLNE